MSIDYGNLAQWASAIVAAGSLIVGTLGYRMAKKAKGEAAAARIAVENIEVQITNLQIRTGGCGGTGGKFGGGGGGGGGSGQSGGDGGDFHVHV